MNTPPMSAHPAPRATRSIRAETAGSSGLALGPNQRGKAGGEVDASIPVMAMAHQRTRRRVRRRTHDLARGQDEPKSCGGSESWRSSGSPPSSRSFRRFRHCRRRARLFVFPSAREARRDLPVIHEHARAPGATGRRIERPPAHRLGGHDLPVRRGQGGRVLGRLGPAGGAPAAGRGGPRGAGLTERAGR